MTRITPFLLLFLLCQVCPALQRHPVSAAMIEHMDQAVGKVVAELERQNLMDRTIIVFTSDNGPAAAEHGNKHMHKDYRDLKVGSAKPLRGDKGSIYEAGTHVPLIVVGPGVTKPDSRNTQAILQSTDFFPTLAEMCGLDTKEYGPFDGKSFAPEDEPPSFHSCFLLVHTRCRQDQHSLHRHR